MGFTGRSHSYDINRDSWIYNKDYDCEVSIVLTSVAFFHKVSIVERSDCFSNRQVSATYIIVFLLHSLPIPPN